MIKGIRFRGVKQGHPLGRCTGIVYSVRGVLGLGVRGTLWFIYRMCISGLPRLNC
jgi:hypothetical protein